MADVNQAGRDDQTTDLPTPQQPQYFYRLKSKKEQHHFQQSEKGILCPICSKELKNIRMHFNKSKECAEKLDMDHFTTMYNILNASVRKGYLTSKKQIEREKKKKEDEESLRRMEANMKQEQRRKKREEDEESLRRMEANMKQEQRRKKRAEDEEYYRKMEANAKQEQRRKKRDEDEVAYMKKGS